MPAYCKWYGRGRHQRCQRFEPFHQAASKMEFSQRREIKQQTGDCIKQIQKEVSACEHCFCLSPLWRAVNRKMIEVFVQAPKEGFALRDPITSFTFILTLLIVAIPRNRRTIPHNKLSSIVTREVELHSKAITFKCFDLERVAIYGFARAPRRNSSLFHCIISFVGFNPLHHTHI